MASLKGGTSLWNAAAVTTGEASAVAYVGPGLNVAVYIENSGAVNATFDIEVAGSLNPPAGRNAFNDSEDPDGGLVWYKYQGATSIAVNAGANTCFDLAPFSPTLVRLKRTDAGGSTTVTAFTTAFGPN